MKKYESYSRAVPWFAALLLSALVVGCGGGRDPILGADGLATTPPSVTDVVPLPNALGVSVNTKVITATFNKAMDPATLSAASFSLACPSETPIVGVVSYLAASNLASLTLPAASSLAPNTPCTATVTTAAKDSTGIALVNNFVWTFTTGAIPDTTAPTVTATINANGATGVAINTKVGATFSEAMDPATITAATFTFKQGITPVAGAISYSGTNAVFAPTSALAINTNYTATLTTGAKDLTGNALASDYVWSWTTAALADTTAPTVVLVNPADLATNVAISSAVNATFSKAMDPLTINTASFAVAGVTGTVAFNATSKIATFTPSAPLAVDTSYTATVSTASKDLAGNALAVSKVWSFRTAAVVVVPPTFDLGSAASFGTMGGSAGITNQGLNTVINGDIGTTAVSTAVTGFHDATPGCTYTETGSNVGFVNGGIYTAPPPPTVGCPTEGTGTASTGTFGIATLALADALKTYNALVAAPVVGTPIAANLSGLTVPPGVYVAPGGSFLLLNGTIDSAGDLTLDGLGDANAVWVFKMATTLTVGGPGAVFPRSINLINGAQAKNVFWQVGSFATINAGGGGIMQGTIISQSGASFSTAGNVTPVILNGRVISLGASVTLVNTVINVPAP
ncbi:MAG: Ig-like domain-containing protein [Comamonadaceae bacterium]